MKNYATLVLWLAALGAAVLAASRILAVLGRNAVNRLP